MVELSVDSVEEMDVIEVIRVVEVLAVTNVHVLLLDAEALLVLPVSTPLALLAAFDSEKAPGPKGKTVSLPPITGSPAAVGLTVSVRITQTVLIPLVGLFGGVGTKPGDAEVGRVIVITTREELKGYGDTRVVEIGFETAGAAEDVLVTELTPAINMEVWTAGKDAMASFPRSDGNLV